MHKPERTESEKIEQIRAAYKSRFAQEAVMRVDDVRREGVNPLGRDRREREADGEIAAVEILDCGDAFDFTGADFASWCREAGFKEIDVLPLAGPTSAGIACSHP